MNDKKQLAAMGEHLAEQQQPMCLQKRVEQLEALLREARDMMDNQPRGFSRMMRRIDNALDGEAGKPAVPEGWKLVPVEPTLEMVTSGLVANTYESDSASCILARAYRAMLAATPEPEAK